MIDNNKILVGKIVAPQGIRGEFRVQTFTASPDDFKHLAAFGNGINAGMLRFVRRLSPTSTVIIARIDNVNDRNMAETLRGTDLFVMRGSLPELAENEYYQADLIGFDVVRDGVKLGKIACFQNFGAGDIMELDSGEMLSFVGANVDIKNKIVSVQ